MKTYTQQELIDILKNAANCIQIGMTFLDGNVVLHMDQWIKARILNPLEKSENFEIFDNIEQSHYINGVLQSERPKTEFDMDHEYFSDNCSH